MEKHNNAGSGLWTVIITITAALAVIYIPFRFVAALVLNNHSYTGLYTRIPTAIVSNMYYRAGKSLLFMSSVIPVVIAAFVLITAIRFSQKKALVIWGIYAAVIVLGNFFLVQWTELIYNPSLLIYNIIHTLIVAASALLIVAMPKWFGKFPSEDALFFTCAFMFLFIQRVVALYASAVILVVFEQRITIADVFSRVFTFDNAIGILKPIVIMAVV
ncbi:MAG: hypothetical protein PHX02_00810, partial [Oscillospiraceae bacterium]|nr:hypothetical protein [Oscillospiraceae bacterium]